jgi:predicted MPP superfamily phosphohydrolase
MRGKRRRALLGIACVIVCTFTYACAVEPNRLVVRRQTIAITDLPPVRIALISDLHAGARFITLDKIHRIVDVVNAEQPDVVLLLGDYLNNGRVAGQRKLKGGFLDPESVAHELGRLHASHGVYAVLGNHDWWFDGLRITRALEQQGITVLENQSIAVHLQDQDLWLVGLADSMTRTPDVAGALSNVPERAPAVVLTHNPDIFPTIPTRVALTVAGHTHGGQVALPWIGRPLVPSRFGERYAAGHVEERQHHLFVTSGIGTSIVPIRFRVPPEIAILTVGSAGSNCPPPPQP